MSLRGDVMLALRDAVKASGKTQSELAAKMGVSRSILTRQLGGGNLCLDTVEAICKALGKSPVLHLDASPKTTALLDIFGC